MNELYKRIENLCKSEGITVTEMCRRAEVPRGNLTDLKNGRQSCLSAKNMNKIANCFNVPMELLLSEGVFEKWDLINQDRRGFIVQCGIDPSILRVIFGIDPLHPDDANISEFSHFLNSAIETMEFDYVTESWIVVVKESFRNKAVGPVLKLTREIKKAPTPVTESGQPVNIVKIAGRDGRYMEKRLTDEQIKALQTIIEQMPDADDL